MVEESTEEEATAARGRDGESESKLWRVLSAVRPLKCHPDEAANQLEHIASDTPRSRAANTHSCGDARRCRLQSAERCIIHARATKTATECG